MNCNKGKWVVIRKMVDYANIIYLAGQTHLKVKYNEVYSWQKIRWILDGEKHLNVHQDVFRILLKMLAKYFKEFILKLKEACFVIVWIDESSFSSASLPLYSWMPKGWDAEHIIRQSSK